MSPGIYLILEVKSDKKGKDIIDSHSTILRSIFRGKNNQFFPHLVSNASLRGVYMK